VQYQLPQKQEYRVSQDVMGCYWKTRLSWAMKMHAQGINDKRLRAYIALQAAYGMEYLHLHFMVHFDLKCDNLLCDLRDLNKPVVKIGDLGLSKTKKGSFISGNMRGTLPW
jgi:serine/threonine protein kinase